jgi:hypothetical protein
MTVREFVRQKPHSPCFCGNGLVAIRAMKEIKEAA